MLKCMKNSNGFVVGAIAVAMMSTTTLLAQSTLPLSLVIKNNEPVPGFAGESWVPTTSAFQNPTIDLNGNVAFSADIADSGNISSANDIGYWYGNTGTLVNQIQEGGPVLPS